MSNKLQPNAQTYHSANSIVDCPGPVIGRLAAAGNGGEVMVQFDTNEPKAARILSGVQRSDLIDPENIGKQVLLLFENNDSNYPIVIGFIQSPLDDMVSLELDRAEAESGEPQTVQARLDGKQVLIEAEDEIQLRCGKGSITIRKDGKIVVKGTHILSRASGPHRIKGGNVAIN